MADASGVVCLDYNDLVQGAGKDLTADIQRAFGVNGLGILTVKNVPGFVAAREALLPLAREFALLDDGVKLKYIHEASKFSFGWSHGKEKLQGKPDESKGSYYANPQFDRPVNDEAIIAQYPAFVHPNIWPAEDLPALEPAFKQLGQLIVSIGTLVAHQCDSFLQSKCSTYQPGRLARVIGESLCCKARLLHYFPMASAGSVASNSDGSRDSTTNSANDDFSSWCGWHNDHGSITGLTSALFMDAAGNAVANTDPTAGLYICSRSGEMVKVSIPPDQIAFQIGETAQIHSGGHLQATPHAVRGSNVPGVSRETFAVFMEPNWTESMDVPEGIAPESAQSQAAAASLPPGVPSLASRWNPAQTFGDFTDSTLSSYY